MAQFYTDAAGVRLPITITLGIEGQEAIKGVNDEFDNLKSTLGMTVGEWKGIHKEINVTTLGLNTMVSPVRSLSWDFMLMGRGLSVLNSHLLGSNKIVNEYIGVVYSLAAVLRIATTAFDVYMTV